ncbi:DUF2934 domain-containing protein [Tropicibacter oceani]|uniref:DUF2934 domain-containing protein n=1 Tax=Tropicibacter oceani TaxID=3058420 RepID=A0ABY8QHF7_9RHOB|nr:DUF2934 domain-containing protein [Tropicibacter oceani]WGW03237.1 DUF2934 domain-containing protein [Tropicibacter oceani]
MTTPQIDDAQIAEAAFYLWLEEGQPEGREQDHWFRAAQALSTPAKPRKPRAKAAAKPAAKKAAPKAKAEAKPKTTKPRARKKADA